MHDGGDAPSFRPMIGVLSRHSRCLHRASRARTASGPRCSVTHLAHTPTAVFVNASKENRLRLRTFGGLEGVSSLFFRPVSTCP